MTHDPDLADLQDALDRFVQLQAAEGSPILRGASLTYFYLDGAKRTCTWDGAAWTIGEKISARRRAIEAGALAPTTRWPATS